MNFETDIEPVSGFRANAARRLDQVRSTGRPLVLTQHGRSAAVLMDVGSYQQMVEELETLRDVHAARADVTAGRVTDHATARAGLLQRYGEAEPAE